MSKSIANSRFIKFAIVGFSGTIVDFSIFNLFSLLLKVPALYASIISFSVAVLNNYYWNREWTYPETKHLSHTSQLSKFAIVSVIGLLIRTPLFSIFEEPAIYLAADRLGSKLPFDPVVIGHNVSLAFVILIVLFWNYFANRFWTYREISTGEYHETEPSGKT